MIFKKVIWVFEHICTWYQVLYLKLSLSNEFEWRFWFILSHAVPIKTYWICFVCFVFVCLFFVLFCFVLFFIFCLFYLLQGVNGKKATVNSTTLDEAYRKFLTGEHGDKVQFGTGNPAGMKSYELNFKTMKQVNMLIGTERKIKRRPEFARKADVKERAKRYEVMIKACLCLCWCCSIFDLLCLSAMST